MENQNSYQKGKDGEDFINEIAYNSFIKYWCYPNPLDEKGDKKEICDLLILFKDVLILICVKNYEFKGVHDRYFRKTIEKDIRQLLGAERKLFNSNRLVFIKHPDRTDLEAFPKDHIKKVYRIVVHLGEAVQFYPMSNINQDEFVTVFDRNTFKTIIEELDTLPDFIDYLNKRQILLEGKTAVVIPHSDDLTLDGLVQMDKYIKQYSNPWCI